ncbi:hypothetical protein SCHPADRAFT_692848 [Schizopora paradoxa]|uniref:Uncharacterized protein n=1 Tax=Schizopora paradoxa TaxID=27342 RepID=A0A0H2R3E8_9AGAM|nr:hypothetical protein SCHPADRAFT_692848 [Schizopora paradoxa]
MHWFILPHDHGVAHYTFKSKNRYGAPFLETTHTLHGCSAAQVRAASLRYHDQVAGATTCCALSSDFGARIRGWMVGWDLGSGRLLRCGEQTRRVGSVTSVGCWRLRSRKPFSFSQLSDNFTDFLLSSSQSFFVILSSSYRFIPTVIPLLPHDTTIRASARSRTIGAKNFRGRPCALWHAGVVIESSCAAQVRIG